MKPSPQPAILVVAVLCVTLDGNARRAAILLLWFEDIVSCVLFAFVGCAAFPQHIQYMRMRVIYVVTRIQCIPVCVPVVTRQDVYCSLNENNFVFFML